jgi:DNA-binding response OmpR family regulator
MKILICDQQRMLAEALASALDARGYDVLAVTTTSAVPSARPATARLMSV